MRTVTIIIVIMTRVHSVLCVRRVVSPRSERAFASGPSRVGRAVAVYERRRLNKNRGLRGWRLCRRRRIISPAKRFARGFLKSIKRARRFLRFNYLPADRWRQRHNPRIYPIRTGVSSLHLQERRCRRRRHPFTSARPQPVRPRVSLLQTFRGYGGAA